MLLLLLLLHSGVVIVSGLPSRAAPCRPCCNNPNGERPRQSVTMNKASQSRQRCNWNTIVFLSMAVICSLGRSCDVEGSPDCISCPSKKVSSSPESKVACYQTLGPETLSHSILPELNPNKLLPIQTLTASRHRVSTSIASLAQPGVRYK